MQSPRYENPDLTRIQALLGRIKTIAVVGLSPRAGRPSHQVAAAMQGFGYHIVPVRPAVDRILGEQAYASLAEIPVPVDLVNVFRAPQHVPAIVDACIELGMPALWLQDGVIDHAAALRAHAAGIFVIMDRCIFRDYMSLR